MMKEQLTSLSVLYRCLSLLTHQAEIATRSSLKVLAEHRTQDSQTERRCFDLVFGNLWFLKVLGLPS